MSSSKRSARRTSCYKAPSHRRHKLAEAFLVLNTSGPRMALQREGSFGGRETTTVDILLKLLGVNRIKELFHVPEQLSSFFVQAASDFQESLPLVNTELRVLTPDSSVAGRALATSHFLIVGPSSRMRIRRYVG